jgi:RNA polymerase sigma-70 factor (ECF subfamily)
MIARRAEDEPVPDDEARDAALVKAALAGDAGACRAIWELYAPLVGRTLRRFFATSSERADLGQEVFLRVFKRLHELRDPTELRRFVMGTCLGVARNDLRRRKIRSIIWFTSDTDQFAGAGGANDETRDVAVRLRRMLDDLGAEDRSLFIARYVEKMDLKEVAAVHKMSLATTRRRVARMTKRVSMRMKGDDALAEYADAFARSGSVSG